MNTAALIKMFSPTGICLIDEPAVIKKWNNNFVISQWKEEYTLIHHNSKATNFTKSDLKVKISKEQATTLIEKLNLYENKSQIFRSGTTWRK